MYGVFRAKDVLAWLLGSILHLICYNRSGGRSIETHDRAHLSSPCTPLDPSQLLRHRAVRSNRPSGHEPQCIERSGKYDPAEIFDVTDYQPIVSQLTLITFTDDSNDVESSIPSLLEEINALLCRCGWGGERK